MPSSSNAAASRCPAVLSGQGLGGIGEGAGIGEDPHPSGDDLGIARRCAVDPHAQRLVGPGDAGADIRRLVTQQFLRIVSVIGLVPMGLSLYEGHPVGSAAGMGFSAAPQPANWPMILAALAAGLAFGRLLRLPAWQLTGALLVSAALALWGQPLSVPRWLMQLSQVVIGTSLGMRFAGLSHAMLIRGTWLSLISVTAMLAIASLIAVLIGPATGQSFEVLLITFAPGGVNEMALVALSLDANPAFVTLHHVFRIGITVLALGLMKRLLTRRRAGTDTPEEL